jgi:membrane protein implicated in regulation of membrane protease activity
MTHPVTFFLVISAAATSAAAALIGSLPLAVAFAALALLLMQSWRLARGLRRLVQAPGDDRREAQTAQTAPQTTADRPARARARFSTLVDGDGPDATLTLLPAMRAGLTRSVVERPSH